VPAARAKKLLRVKTTGGVVAARHDTAVTGAGAE
jgi:hypothetical protein